MLKVTRELAASWSIDDEGARAQAASGPMGAVHRSLSESRPTFVRSPAGLRTRIMDRVRAEEPAATAGSIGGWKRAAAMAAVMGLLVGGTLYLAAKPRPQSGPMGSGIPDIPMTPGAMIQLVVGKVDRQLVDQAQKMVSDTQRATRAVVGRMPFSPIGG